MDVLVLTDIRTGSTTHIIPELGFNCFEFRTNVAGQVVDVIDASPQFASGNDPAQTATAFRCCSPFRADSRGPLYMERPRLWNFPFRRPRRPTGPGSRFTAFVSTGRGA